VRHARLVLAIEMLCACQALDLRAPLQPGRGVAAAHAVVRRAVPFMKVDRRLAPDIAAVEALLAGGALRAHVEGTTGRLA
jgi:histidine ammonia-lyase